jgi:protein phosphatase
VEFADLSDVGCQRERNEDSRAYWQPISPDDCRRKGRLAVVADGMGGYQGGQEASRIAVQTVCDIYANTTGTPQALLLAALNTAHGRIRDYARQHPALFGMGTTCTAISITDSHLYFAHIGDSRLYLVHDAKISRLTRDHSYVGRLVESGLIAETDAEAHPQRHVLTAALGVGDEVTPDAPLHPLPLDQGDVLVLCTDGLWGLISDEELRARVTQHAPSDACRELVSLARERGAPDNVTVQVMRCVGNGRSRRGSQASTAF